MPDFKSIILLFGCLLITEMTDVSGTQLVITVQIHEWNVFPNLNIMNYIPLSFYHTEIKRPNKSPIFV